MKVRNGFVSNSSSSSFVIVLPDNFDTEKLDYSKALGKLDVDFFGEDIGDLSDKDIIERLKLAVKNFISSGFFCEAEDRDFIEILREFFSDYEIASFDTGPDQGEIIIANNKKIKSILGIK
jgi:hypothetical protein